MNTAPNQPPAKINGRCNVEYIRYSRTKLAGLCGCGQRGRVYKSGSWVCERCERLEAKYYGMDSIGRRLRR